MVARFLDVDRDRANRLEDRLDHLMNVVRATVLNKNESSPSPPPEITNLHPPPKLGMVPPKLDLVPPKPCRVPCTIPNSNIELINQNPILTRPGIVSPITASPAGKKPGAIWSKLGPVSTSPFVKAQQRLGFQPTFNNDLRTQSSAERRITKEVGRFHMDTQYLIYETVKLLEMERQLEEKIENARLEADIGQLLTARRKLFTQREPTPIMILTANFLDAECRVYEHDPPYWGTWNSRKMMLIRVQRENFLAGQGESYERMRHLNAAVRCNDLGCEPCDTSTPAKPLFAKGVDEVDNRATKPTIQQLARLVMNSARWRDIAAQNQQRKTICPATAVQSTNQNAPDVEYNATFTAPKANAPPSDLDEQQRKHNEEVPNGRPLSLENDLRGQPKFPMGFTTAMLSANDQKGATLPREMNGRDRPKSLGFTYDNPLTDRKNNVRFMDEALLELQRMYNERQAAKAKATEIPEILLPFLNNDNGLSAQNRNMIERYVNDLMPKKLMKDKDTDSDNDDEYLDTTTTMHPVRRGSLTSNGTASTETHSSKSSKLNNCRIS